MSEQKHVAWLSNNGNVMFGRGPTRKYIHPLYATPPQQKPLTDEKVYALVDATLKHGRCALARAIERAHGIGGES
jgi:hypothetical protein